MKKLLEVVLAACFLVALVTATMMMLLWGDLFLPVVQLDGSTKEVVAVITCDGIVHPPEYIKKVGKYNPVYVSPGYRPAKFGITERELKDLKE